MADKNYKLKFTLTDGKTQEVEFTAPQGPKGDTGSQGPKGDKGDKGDTGATGPQGPAGADGAKGETGAAGKDGANGTSVTVKSVSESSTDGGNNVVTFSDGKTVTIKNGSKGSTGATGDTGPAGADASVYATCDTAAATAAKVVTVSGNDNWTLRVGSVVMVYFANSNSASNVTLNVNGTGAYPIWYNNAEYTSTGTAYTGYAKRVIEYMFNGTHWVWMGASYDSNTTYKNVSLGHGYATCSTAAATAAKVGTLASYALTLGGIVAVKFTYEVPANATLNINSKGAKNMFYRGAKITAGVIKAGDIATFIYDGTQYQLLSIDRWQNDVAALQTSLNQTAASITQLASDKADKTGLTLGVHTDGLVYLFVNGSPQGNGLEITAETVEGDVFGYVEEDNTIVLNGSLADGTYSIKYEMENGNTIDIGNLVIDTNVYYTVTNTLTQCTTNNSATKAVQGGSYSATITAKSGYELSSVKVTMGGTDISSTAVSGGKITISNVTGNIVITAVATEKVVTPTYTNLFVPSKATINSRINSQNAVVSKDGHIITNTINVSSKVPFADGTKIYIKGAAFTADGNTKISTYTANNATATTAPYGSLNGSAITTTNEGNGVISVPGSVIKTLGASGVKSMIMVLQVSTSAITAADIQNIVITIDEPIA